MAKNPETEHDFLDLRTDGFGDRTPMGGMRLSSRSGMFLVFGLLALAVFTGMYLYVDRRVDEALENLRAAQELAGLTSRVEAGVGRIQALEKQFLLSKDPGIAEAFGAETNRLTGALDGLEENPGTTSIRAHLATLRDGLAQYNQQFAEVVKAEQALGITDESGVSRGVARSTGLLRDSLKAAGYENLFNQVARINRETRETVISGLAQGVDEIRKRYLTLRAFLKSAEMSAENRAVIGEQLKAHETGTLAMINSRFALDRETQRFNDILAYVSPSLDNLSDQAADALAIAVRAVDKVQLFARTTLAGGSAAIVLWLTLAGMVMMRNMISSVRLVAGAASRLADGDRGANVPARGNRDAVGQIARSLDKWIDDLVAMDLLRQELEQTKAKLSHTVRQAEADAVAAAEAARAALMREDEPVTEAGPEVSPAPAPPPEAAPPAQPAPSPRAPDPAYLAESRPLPVLGAPRGGAQGGPISSISQQLAHFSEYVTAAAGDVERTEAMVRGLNETTRQVEDLGVLVTAIRDQTNLLAFRSGPAPRDFRPDDSENLVPFTGDDGRSEQAMTERLAAQRFDAIRDAVDKAERTFQALRLSVADVTAMAQEIATTASTQALEATNKLLHQSEYLQSMLDDIISKIHPPARGQLAGPSGEGRSDERERSPDTGFMDSPPPRKY